MSTTSTTTNKPPADNTITDSRGEGVIYYTTTTPQLSPEARNLLQDYSHIPPEEVASHVISIRDKAWDVYPYPCIGLFRFMALVMHRLPIYPAILSRLKSGEEVFLDLGCCFGQEIRDLVHHGVPSKNLYGSDLRREFWDLGYELFQDREMLQSRFFVGDVFDEESELRELHGKVDVIYAGSFFHLFDWEKQVRVGKRVVSLLKPGKGSVAVGRQIGRKVGGEVPHRREPAGTMWRHDAESWAEMWRQIGRETGTEWDCKSEAEEFTEVEKDFLSKDGRGFWDGTGDNAAIKFAFVVERVG